jgi:inner membrane protein
LAAGWSAARPSTGRRALAVQVAILAALGCAPDLDLLIHRHSRETHSIGAAVIAASIAAWRQWPIAETRGRIWLAAFLAWVSHPILDMLSLDTSIPLGVMFLWPFSRDHMQTGLNIFSSIYRNYHESGFLLHNALAALREFAIVAPVTAFVWWRRRGVRS